MNTQSCGEPYPYGWWQIPYQPPTWFPTYAPMLTNGTGCVPYSPPTEERIREIIREELCEALKDITK